MLVCVFTDDDRCLRAVQSKDVRFDGWFFTAVLTTGIYCRPSCPVVPPKARSMRFYPTAAAAQQAGFRACKRCRPDASPGSPEWNHRADLVARAMRLIADGVVDREGVPGLAAGLGYSVRQVQRQMLAELGAGPLAIARAQRAQTARLLIETSTLPMADVAFAAGFSSVRSFNDAVRQVFALSPTELHHRAARGRTDGTAGLVSVRLPFRPPLNPDNLFGHLAATAVPGVLRADPVLRPLVDKHPGRRVPRTVDGPEFAVCAVLGQQVSTAAARTHAARLVLACGVPVGDPAGGLTHLFPDSDALTEVDPSTLAFPQSRRTTFAALTRALAAGEIDLGAGSDWDRDRSRLADLPGVGPWTVETIAMRALGDPDAFTATDLGIRLAARHLGLPEHPRLLTERSRAWQPWRSYAVQYLWASGDHAINRLPA